MNGWPLNWSVTDHGAINALKRPCQAVAVGLAFGKLQVVRFAFREWPWQTELVSHASDGLRLSGVIGDF